MTRDRCHIDTALQQNLSQAIDQHCDKPWAENLQRCVPIMVDLLVRNHSEPVRHLEPAIREVIVERCLVGSAPSAQHSDPHIIDRHVKLITRELELLRRHELTHGTWSDAPVPQQFFG